MALAAAPVLETKSQAFSYPAETAVRRSARQISARQPLLWGALAFSAGICAGRYFWRPVLWWMVAAVVFLTASAYFSKRRALIARILVAGAMLCAGALSLELRSSDVFPPAWLPEGEASITAHVSSEGSVEAQGPGEFRQRIDVVTETITQGALTRNVAECVRLSIYQHENSRNALVQPAMQLLRYGQRIRLKGSLIAPRNYRNPGAFDYAGYLRDSGIVAVSSSKWSDVQVMAGFSGTRVELWRSRIHRSIIGKIHQLWPEKVAGLMDAIVIGEETFIDRPTRVDFQRSGTYHVLVVSGMNVSILAMFTLWVMRRVGLRDVAASMVAVGFILFYAVLTKEGSPVWRAALMFAVYLCTRLLYRDRAMLNALGLAAFILLVADPRQLFGASFQMTFLCVALVAGIGIPVLERTSQPYSHGLRNLSTLAYDRGLAPQIAQFRIDVRMILGRIALIWPASIARVAVIGTARFALALFEVIVMSAMLQLGLALPMAYYFHRATSMAMPANLLVIPFLELLMPAAVLAICASYLWMPLAKIPAMIGGFALQGIAGTVKWLGGMRLADIRVPTPNLCAIIFAAVAIGTCAVLVRKRAGLVAAGISMLAFSALWMWTIPAHENVRAGVLEMTAIDVGQGDSIFLVTPQGRKILVDAGGLPFWTHSQLDIGEDVVSPYLWARGIARLDAVALTHAHADHMGGMFAVISNFRPRELWLPAGIPREEIERLLAEARQFAVKINYFEAGDSLTFGGAVVSVLAPRRGAAQSDSRRNDESLVMKISYGKTSALLEGDAEKATERLIESEDPAADVLKVAHHGSASSTSDPLLARVKPRFAVISVGAHNVYHHPRQEVLERLRRSRVLTYRTDMNGATSFFLDGSRVTPQPATIR